MNRNTCYRGAPCLNGTPVPVSRGGDWDYYDKASGSYIYLECRLHQKFYSDSLLQIEEAEKFQSGLSTESYETADLQFADYNGVWMTHSDDPENYRWSEVVDDGDSLEEIILDDARSCNRCDIICEIRGRTEYLNEDGSCPYPDPAPTLRYWKVEDADTPCGDYLHPLLLQDIEGMNAKKRRMTKSKLWGYLKQKKWRDLRITKGERMTDIWERNYQPSQVYYRSLETIWLYMKNLPSEMKENKHLMGRIRKNVRQSPSFKECIDRGEWEKRMWGKINTL